MEEAMKTEETVKQTVEAILKELKLQVPEIAVVKQGEKFMVICTNPEMSAEFEVELREGGILFLLRVKDSETEEWQEVNKNFSVFMEEIAE